VLALKVILKTTEDISQRIRIVAIGSVRGKHVSFIKKLTVIIIDLEQELYGEYAWLNEVL